MALPGLRPLLPFILFIILSAGHKSKRNPEVSPGLFHFFRVGIDAFHAGIVEMGVQIGLHGIGSWHPAGAGVVTGQRQRAGVPVALLDMKKPMGVIKNQVPVAIIMMVVQIVMMILLK